MSEPKVFKLSREAAAEISLKSACVVAYNTLEELLNNPPHRDDEVQLIRATLDHLKRALVNASDPETQAQFSWSDRARSSLQKSIAIQRYVREMRGEVPGSTKREDPPDNPS